MYRVSCKIGTSVVESMYMKTFTTLVLGLLLIPSASLAAPLTNDQANSLIAVVQSSPTTPASAFTNLITAFSSITVLQAESLITVVQAAPGVPATAFVNMLLAFTVDPVAPVLGAAQSPVVDNTQTSPAPVVQSTPVPTKKITIERNWVEHKPSPYGVLFGFVVRYTEDGKDVDGVPVTISAPNGNFLSEWPDDPILLEKTKTTKNGRGVNFDYTIGSDKPVTVTATANGLTETIVVGIMQKKGK